MKLPMRFSRFKKHRTLRGGVFVVLAAVIGISVYTALPAHAAIALRAVSTANNGTGSTSVTLSPPTGSVAGDVLVAYIATRGGSSTITSPAGWTSVTSAASSTALKGGVFTKAYSASDTTYGFTLSASAKAAGIIVGYSGADVVSVADVANSQANASSTTMTAPSITTTQANTMLVGLYASATSTTYTAGSSMTLRGQTASSGSGSASTKVTIGAQDITQASAAATGTKTMAASAAAVSVGALVALRPAPVISQAGYRFFQNTDSTTASTAYAASGTPATIPASTPFRLRLNLGVASSGSTMTNTAGRNFTLQYARRGADNVCDASFTNETYADVTTSTSVRFYNNPTPADGAAYVTSANDPTRSGITAVGQKYMESNPLAASTTVLAGQDALWDVSLTTSGVNPDDVYCLRALDANGAVTLGGGYNSMPQFTVQGASITQANYRWFANANSTTPGSPLAAQDTAASIDVSTPFRLRQRLAVDTMALAQSGKDFKLQYAEKAGTCDPGFTGESYSDVNAAGSLMSTLTPTTASNTANGGGTDWTNPEGGITSGDSSMAYIQSPHSGVNSYTTSSYLTLSGFGFNIPAGATVTGIKINMAIAAEYLNGAAETSGQDGVFLYAGGSLQTVAGSTVWHTGDTSEVLGGSTQLFSRTWTPAEINDSNFGLYVQVTARFAGSVGKTSKLSVDGAEITVYYTNPSLLQYYDNSTPTDPTTITSLGSDPINGARSTIYQSYRETDPFTNNVAAISSGSDGLWDFSLTSTPAAAGKTYCYRVVKSDGGLLDSYSKIPEITFTSPSGGPTLEQQVRGGQAVVNGVKSPFTW